MSAWVDLLMPPEWDSWSWPQRLSYLGIFGLLMGGASAAAHAIARAIV